MRHLVFLALLIAVGPISGQAQDTTPPTITSAVAAIDLTRNGDPLTVTVDAAADEPARFEVTCTYTSSYLPFVEPPLAYWHYKTQAVGDHVETSQPPTMSVTDLEVVVGPRVYHSDTLTVSVVAIDAAGNRSAPVVVHDAAIEMPFTVPLPIQPGDHYAVTTHWSGSTKPSDYNKASLADWAQPDLILCTTGFLFEGPQTDPGWDHWVERLRAEPGANNVAVIGFSGLSTVNNPSYPVQQRMFAFLWSVHDEVDDNVLVHVTDGTIAAIGDGRSGRILANVFSQTARDTLAWFFAQEWNHSENREPRVGFMFDVYEIWTDYPVNDEYAGWLIDRDRDGIPLLDDPDELEGTRSGRVEFLQTLRNHIAATSSDPNVGQYFLIGANTVSGRSDALMLAELDFVMLEDLQCPPGAGTEFIIYDGDGCYGEHARRLPFHGAAAEHFTREYCPGIYYENHLITSGAVPQPSDLSQAWEDLPSRMRHDAGGPFLVPESRGSVSGEPIHPGHLEVFSLLFDHFYPIWHRQDDSWDRQYWHPSEEGLFDLHDLGPAISPLIRETMPDDILYWRRQYASGSVEIIIADTTVFDCAAGDLFDYRVTVSGETRRQSPGWGPPEFDTFFVADWDTGGAESTVRVDLTAIASEPVRWQRSYRVGASGPWSDPDDTSGRTEILAGFWNTSLPAMSGSLWVRLQGVDQTGRTTGWAKREVVLHRFGGFGVVIEDTTVVGTVYGLKQPDGDYEVLGRGSSAPDFAPPHYLEIHGSVPAGFVPVEVRWRNNLGGQGVAEGGSSWRIPGVPLHRGVNVITITCVDAGGTARVGSVTKMWDYPGRPGRDR